MINFYTTSQASFREKRVVFQLESTPNWKRPDESFRVAELQPPLLNTSELRARSAAGAVNYMPALVSTEVAQTKSSEAADDATPAATVALATADTHDAVEALRIPEPVVTTSKNARVEAPTMAPASLQVPREAIAAPVTAPTPKLAAPVPTASPAPARVDAKTLPKQGFFSRLFSKSAPPDAVVDQALLNAKANAPQRFAKTAQTTHSDVLYSEQVKEGQTKVLDNPTLTDRLARANSNDIYAQIQARYPKLKIGFDGRIEGLNIMQRLSFSSKLGKDPVLAAMAHELQRRAGHIKSVTSNF